MGSGSSSETHHYHTEYVPDPETVRQLKEAEERIAKLEEEAREMGDPEHFTSNVGKLFNNFIDEVGSLKLTDVIDKSGGQTHIGFIGPVTAGKTTLINTLYGTSRPVALGHCTSECEVVHQNDKIVVWDLPGEDNSFKYYNPETLSFIKNLDYCVILFDSDVSVVSWIIKTVHAINPDSMVVIRTKVDQCGVDSERTVAEEKALDSIKTQELLGLEVPPNTYAISSHNVMRERDEKFDWNDLRSMLNCS